MRVALIHLLHLVHDPRAVIVSSVSTLHLGAARELQTACDQHAAMGDADDVVAHPLRSQLEELSSCAKPLQITPR